MKPIEEFLKQCESNFLNESYFKDCKILVANHDQYGDVVIVIYPDDSFKVFIPEMVYIKAVRKL
jgi:hypothetical protein